MNRQTFLAGLFILVAGNFATGQDDKDSKRIASMRQNSDLGLFAQLLSQRNSSRVSAARKSESLGDFRYE